MGFSLVFLLCCELSLGRADDLQGRQIQRGELLPPPHIFLRPSFPGPEQSPATIECVGAYRSQFYFLWREPDRPYSARTVVKQVASQWEGRMGTFTMTTTAQSLGPYSCMYAFNSYFSDFSERVTLMMRALPEEPLLTVPSANVSTLRQSLTFQCNASSRVDSFFLYHGSLDEQSPFIKPFNTSPGRGVFYFRELHMHLLGQYTCIARHSGNPYVWSEVSNMVLITYSPPESAAWPPLIPVAGLLPTALTMLAWGEWLA